MGGCNKDIFENNGDFDFNNEEFEELDNNSENEFDDDANSIDDEFPDLPEELKKPIRLLVRKLFKDLSTGLVEIYLDGQNRQDR